MKEDRQLSKDIAAVKALLEDGAIVRAVESVVGKLY
jgi:histidine ammonia-lyase